MKRNSLTKGLVVSVALSAMLTGCGSLESLVSEVKDDVKDDFTKKIEKQLKEISINGKAIDGYLQYATVCLDINKDGYCQSIEPMSTTEIDGSFRLDISPEIQKNDDFAEAMLLVYGGRDKDTGTDFRGKLLAPSDAEVVNISPLSTLIAKVVQKELKADKKLTKKEIKEKVEASKKKVASVFGLEVEDLMKDPVAEKDNNPKLIKEALKIQKAVEGLNINGSNDDLEKIYEKLAETLEHVEDDKGMVALLDKAFKDETDRLQIAKDINENIEKSFEKFDGDLEKIGHITKEDMKKLKNQEEIKREDNDPLFQDGVDWDEIYIKSGLEDIGISTPSLEQIDEIKKIGGDITPGIIIDIKKKLKDSEDDALKDIYKELKKDEAKKDKKKEQEKAMYDGQNIKFEKGMTLYEFDLSYGDVEYTKIHIGKDDLVYVKEFLLRDGEFVEDIRVDTPTYKSDYVLKNGTWVEDDSDNKTELKYRLDANGVIKLTESNVEVSLLSQKDISGRELFIDTINDFITMPKGSEVSYIGVKQLEDEYEIYNKVEDYSTISEYIANQCSSGYYLNKDGSTCNADTKSGKVKESKYSKKENEWQIKTVDNIEILFEENDWSKDTEERIYAVLNDSLYRGYFYENLDKKGFDKDLEPNYNKVAMEAIKGAILDSFTYTTTDPVIVKDPVADDDNGTVHNLKEMLAGKTFYRVRPYSYTLSDEVISGYNPETITFDKNAETKYMSSNELGTFINVVENNLFINEDSRDTLILTYVDSDSDTIIFTDDNGKKVVFFTNEDKMRAEIEKL